MSRPRFHLAFPVHNLEETRRFYIDLLGCREGRSSERWVDFDFYGHQIVAHLADETRADATNDVDGHAVPVRHFGLILPREDWQVLADRLRGQPIRFLIEPEIRFAGSPAEQAIFFIQDPSGNALEFKAFERESAIFARR